MRVTNTFVSMHIVIMCSVIDVLLCHTLRNNTKVLFLSVIIAQKYTPLLKKEKDMKMFMIKAITNTSVNIAISGKNKSELNHHLNSLCLKNPDHVIECVYCSHSIMGIPQFINHLNEDHKKKGEHLCFRCQSMFKIEDNLLTHMSHSKCKKM